MTQPLQLVPMDPEDIRAALQTATEAMDLAIDVGEWAEAIELRAWCIRLKNALPK